MILLLQSIILSFLHYHFVVKDDSNAGKSGFNTVLCIDNGPLNPNRDKLAVIDEYTNWRSGGSGSDTHSTSDGSVDGEKEN